MSDGVEREMRRAILGLAGSVAAADDQARAMTDSELGECLLNGRWSTIEIHEAGLRLIARSMKDEDASVPGRKEPT